MSTFKLNILKLDSEVFAGDVTSLKLRAMDGELQILAHHEPYINRVLAGKISFVDAHGKQSELQVSDGFLKVENNTAELFV